MVLVLFYLVGIVMVTLLVGVAVTIYIAFWILAVLTAIVIDIIATILRWRGRRPKRPKFSPPLPQARYSNRR